MIKNYSLLLVLAIPLFSHAGASGFEKKPRVAICYWGLTRSTKKVYQTHFDKIFNVLEKNDMPHDVFMHTWSLKGSRMYKVSQYKSRSIMKNISYWSQPISEGMTKMHLPMP